MKYLISPNSTSPVQGFTVGSKRVLIQAFNLPVGAVVTFNSVLNQIEQMPTTYCALEKLDFKVAAILAVTPLSGECVYTLTPSASSGVLAVPGYYQVVIPASALGTVIIAASEIEDSVQVPDAGVLGSVARCCVCEAAPASGGTGSPPTTVSFNGTPAPSTTNPDGSKNYDIVDVDPIYTVTVGGVPVVGVVSGNTVNFPLPVYPAGGNGSPPSTVSFNGTPAPSTTNPDGSKNYNVVDVDSTYTVTVGGVPIVGVVSNNNTNFPLPAYPAGGSGSPPTTVTLNGVAIPATTNPDGSKNYDVVDVDPPLTFLLRNSSGTPIVPTTYNAATHTYEATLPSVSLCAPAGVVAKTLCAGEQFVGIDPVSCAPKLYKAPAATFIKDFTRTEISTLIQAQITDLCAAAGNSVGGATTLTRAAASTTELAAANGACAVLITFPSDAVGTVYVFTHVSRALTQGYTYPVTGATVEASKLDNANSTANSGIQVVVIKSTSAQPTIQVCSPAGGNGYGIDGEWVIYKVAGPLAASPVASIVVGDPVATESPSPGALHYIFNAAGPFAPTSQRSTFVATRHFSASVGAVCADNLGIPRNSPFLTTPVCVPTAPITPGYKYAPQPYEVFGVTSGNTFCPIGITALHNAPLTDKFGIWPEGGNQDYNGIVYVEWATVATSNTCSFDVPSTTSTVVLTDPSNPACACPTLWSAQSWLEGGNVSATLVPGNRYEIDFKNGTNVQTVVFDSTQATALMNFVAPIPSVSYYTEFNCAAGPTPVVAKVTTRIITRTDAPTNTLTVDAFNHRGVAHAN